jgi:hypothetical protein
MDAPIGSPPTLEWIAVERLAIDESYQRATDSPASRRLINRIKQGWNWSFCQPLVVSRRTDGSLFVIDGQHRLSGAIGRGDIPHLPCVVVTDADEAQTFIALNTQRQKLSQGDIFNAMLAAGDDAAKTTATILDETGWKLTRNHTISVTGRLNCAPMIARAVRKIGECPVRNALTALREAYPDQPVPNAATLLKPLFTIYRDKRISDPDLLIELLGAVSPLDWQLESAGLRLRNPQLSREEALVECLVRACEDAATDGKLAA